MIKSALATKLGDESVVRLEVRIRCGESRSGRDELIQLRRRGKAICLADRRCQRPVRLRRPCKTGLRRELRTGDDRLVDLRAAVDVEPIERAPLLIPTTERELEVRQHSPAVLCPQGLRSSLAISLGSYSSVWASGFPVGRVE